MTCPDCGIDMEFAPTPWTFTGSDLHAANIYFCIPCGLYWQLEGRILVPAVSPSFFEGTVHA